MYVYVLGREGVKLPNDGIQGGGVEFEPWLEALFELNSDK